MRRSKQETAKTRGRIVANAAREFRRSGIDRTSVIDLMAKSGLTHGGFYAHFPSKERLTEEALSAASNEMLKRLKRILKTDAGNAGLEAALRGYLSVHHRDARADGCVFTALAGEVTRANGALREEATRGFLRWVDVLQTRIEDLRPGSDARSEALYMISAMIGALTMARMVTDPETSKSILQKSLSELIARIRSVRRRAVNPE